MITSSSSLFHTHTHKRMKNFWNKWPSIYWNNKLTKLSSSLFGYHPSSPQKKERKKQNNQVYRVLYSCCCCCCLWYITSNQCDSEKQICLNQITFSFIGNWKFNLSSVDFHLKKIGKNSEKKILNDKIFFCSQTLQIWNLVVRWILSWPIIIMMIIICHLPLQNGRVFFLLFIIACIAIIIIIIHCFWNEMNLMRKVYLVCVCDTNQTVENDTWW
mgnify:CR=1 FL=1